MALLRPPRFLEDKDWPGVPTPGFKASFPDIEKHGFKAFFQDYYDVEFSDFNPKPDFYNQLMKLLMNGPEEDLEILLKGINICDATDLREAFKSIQCPIDLILGGRDTWSVSACHEAIQRLNRKVNLHVIPEAQHFLFWTHPVAFQKILRHILCNDD